MTTIATLGIILTRCPECGNLSYDPRTGTCDR